MRWSIFLLVFQILSSCHSHPVFAQKETLCSLDAKVYGDPLLSLYHGNDAWTGDGSLTCFSVDGATNYYKIKICLSSWTSNESLSTKMPQLRIFSGSLLVDSPWDIISTMEIMTIPTDTSTKQHPQFKMLGWPFVENYDFHLSENLNPELVKHIKHGTLTIEQNQPGKLKCGSSSLK